MKHQWLFEDKFSEIGNSIAWFVWLVIRFIIMFTQEGWLHWCDVDIGSLCTCCLADGRHGGLDDGDLSPLLGIHEMFMAQFMAPVGIYVLTSGWRLSVWWESVGPGRNRSLSDVIVCWNYTNDRSHVQNGLCASIQQEWQSCAGGSSQCSVNHSLL